jgi:Putative amidoligase enzyme
MASSNGGQAFLLPPVIHNRAGEVRRAGFEFEFSGLNLEMAAGLVQRVFGGCDVPESTFARRVVDTPYGDVTVEIDSTFLKQKHYERPLRSMGLDLDRLDTQPLENLLIGVASNMVPFEIGLPPIPVTELEPLEELRRLLHEHRAEGTRASLLYMFGLHINPESPRVDAPTLLNHLRSFILLYPWLEEQIQVDITRRLGPYINSFPPEYARLILAEDYPAMSGRLIADYVRFNPTRNRPLDMLPILACLDRERTLSAIEDPHLTRPRPAFHYRMPNSLIDEPDWRVAREWNTWVIVERLANDTEQLDCLAREYLTTGTKWPAVLREFIQDYQGRNGEIPAQVRV